MARTKASVGAKVSSGKSSKARCSAAPPSYSAGSSGSSDKSSRNYSGGNPVCPRETPNWQKPITSFFMTNTSAPDDDQPQASSSKPKPKKNVIQSDDETENSEAENERTETETGTENTETETETEKPKNHELDETIDLEPLNGEECHKIEEYYPSKEKKKGKGKKSNKENIGVRQNSLKRDLEQVIFGEEQQHVSKKVKVN